MLKALTDDVLVLSTLTGDGVRAYFKWISTVVQRKSEKPGQVNEPFQQNIPDEIRPTP